MLTYKLLSLLPVWLLLTPALASGASKAQYSRTCVIPKHEHGGDDSPAIIKAFEECGHNGHIIFSEGTVYNVESTLPLQNLNNVQVDLRGTIMFSTDVRYWIQHGSYYPFQNISIAMEFSGEDITIDGHGTGIINGQGQVWYDLAMAVGGYYGRPIPFSFRNARNSVAKNFQILQSGKWNFVIVESENIVADNIYLSSTSDDFQANPGNLGNTDGFDTVNSRNITIQNSYVNTGDDCVSIKPGSYDIHVKNLTCVNTGGIAIGSLGQYQGQEDIVENFTAEDVTLIGARNGPYIKTWVGLSVYYPPQGGGNGSGVVRNVLFKNFRIENGISSPPIHLSQCTTYAGYGVPDDVCTEYPSTGFVFENITWENITGYTNSSAGNTTLEIACSPNAKCSGFTFKDIDIKPGTGGEAVFSCTNLDGYDSSCQKI